MKNSKMRSADYVVVDCIVVEHKQNDVIHHIVIHNKKMPRWFGEDFDAGSMKPEEWICTHETLNSYNVFDGKWKCSEFGQSYYKELLDGIEHGDIMRIDRVDQWRL